MTENVSETPKAVTPAVLTAPDIPPAEAGFSINWQMVDGHGCALQLTMRAPFVDDWEYVFVKRAEFMERALKKGWSFQSRQQAPNTPTATTSDAERAVASGKGNPMPTKSSPPRHTPVLGGGTQGGKPIQVFKADKVVIEPKENGKTRVNFWATGRKYADLYGTKLIEHWVDLFEWDEQAFCEMGSFDVKCEVGYTLSDKTNEKGNPYKDIQYIKVLE